MLKYNKKQLSKLCRWSSMAHLRFTTWISLLPFYLIKKWYKNIQQHHLIYCKFSTSLGTLSIKNIFKYKHKLLKKQKVIIVPKNKIKIK